MKQRPFSKLKKQIESLFEPELGMEFCCSAYRHKTQWSEMNIPRFYIKLDKEVIWDMPKDFDDLKKVDYRTWIDDVDICGLVRDYIDTPVENLIAKKFERNKYNMVHQYIGVRHQDVIDVDFKLTEIFIAADRRIGKQKLMAWSGKINNKVVNKIIGSRYEKDSNRTRHIGA